MSADRTLHVMEHGEVFMANERQWVRIDGLGLFRRVVCEFFQIVKSVV